MSQADSPQESPKPDGNPPGSMVLIGFCIAVLLLFAVMVNRPQWAAEWSARLLGRDVAAVSSCTANLKQLDGATQQWALENKKAATDTYSLTDPTLLAYLKGSMLPFCPQGGHYSAGTNLTDWPRCSHPGHTL